MKRRGFLKKIAAVSASVAGTFAVFSFLHQLLPGRIRRSRKVKIGKVADFPVDTFTYIDEDKIFVYRDNEAMKSVSAVCTHLGCTIQHTTEGFECPCHGSRYSDNGEVLSGPAPRDLSWYKMEKLPDGSIIVDMDEEHSAEDRFYLS